MFRRSRTDLVNMITRPIFTESICLNHVRHKKDKLNGPVRCRLTAGETSLCRVCSHVHQWNFKTAEVDQAWLITCPNVRLWLSPKLPNCRGHDIFRTCFPESKSSEQDEGTLPLSSHIITALKLIMSH